MASNNASPFYDGYVYWSNGFKCQFKQHASILCPLGKTWCVGVEDEGALRMTPHCATKTEAYAEAEKLTKLMWSRKEILDEED